MILLYINLIILNLGELSKVKLIQKNNFDIYHN